MKRNVSVALVLVMFLLCAVLLFGCNADMQGDGVETTGNTDKGLETEPPASFPVKPPADITEYEGEIYLSGSDKEVARVITSVKQLNEFLLDDSITTGTANETVKDYLGKVGEYYGDLFFLKKNLIVCISKKGDTVCYGQVNRFYGNSESIEILFDNVYNKEYYGLREFYSSAVVFEVPKDLCNENTAVTFMTKERKADPLTSPDKWIADNIDKDYHTTGERYFPDEFYNIAIMGFLRPIDKLEKYMKEVFPREYNGLTPPLYMLISYFDVKFGEFDDANDALLQYNKKFGDFYTVYPNASSYVNTMGLFAEDEFSARKSLCKNNYVYYDGVFYDFLESETIVYKYQAHTFKEWFWTFSEDPELYEEFLLYSDAKSYSRFKYDLDRLWKLADLLKEGQVLDDAAAAEIQRNRVLLKQKIDYEDILVIDTVEKGHLDRYYGPKIVENGFPSVFFRIKEVRAYYYENYLYKSAADLSYLPTAYYLIRDLNLKSRVEEFRLENEYRITTTDEITRSFIDLKDFELLFGNYDEETLKKELKRPTVFYFEGKLYDLEDLKTAESTLVEKMGAGAEFKEYLTNLKNMRIFKESAKEYRELVNGYLEKYYGIK